jgi:hypothetical protein
MRCHLQGSTLNRKVLLRCLSEKGEPQGRTCGASLMELWAEVPVPGWWISNLGRLCGPDGLVEPRPTNRGYHQVTIAGLIVGIHRLVLAAFMGPCPSGREAAHWNGDKSDNRLANLRWATPDENASDKIRHNLERRNALKVFLGTTQSGPRIGKNQITCAECGSSFKAVRSTATFCSSTCRTRAHRRAAESPAA